MFDSDDTTTVAATDNDEDQILFLNGSQRRGDFVEKNNPPRSPRIKPASQSIPKRAFKDYA
jgi:hypothetical protein